MSTFYLLVPSSSDWYINGDATDSFLFLPILMPLPMRASFHLHVLTGEVWLIPKELCGTIYFDPGALPT